MNLTVAMKIIGGFAIIAVLLIITSAISLLNLNTIQDSTVQQSEVAIPTLKGSNKLANTLTQIGNLTLRAYYQTEYTPLSANLASYNKDKEDFSKIEQDLDYNLGFLKSIQAKLNNKRFTDNASKNVLDNELKKQKDNLSKINILKNKLKNN